MKCTKLTFEKRPYSIVVEIMGQQTLTKNSYQNSHNPGDHLEFDYE